MIVNLLIPFTLKLHIFYAVFFNVVAVIKASSVRQIHKQTHFHLRKDQRDMVRRGSGNFKILIRTSVFTELLTLRLFK